MSTTPGGASVRPTLSQLYFRHFFEHFSRTMRYSLNGWFCAVLFALAALLGPQTANAALAKSVVLENNVAYLRLAQTDKNLPDEIMSAFNSLSATNTIIGIVLDLRFAGGSDGDSVKSSEQVLEQKKLPLAILVNAQTTGAAAGMANDLREADAGLIFGNATTNLQPDIAVSVGTNNEQDLLQSPYGVMALTNTISTSNTNLLPFVDVDHTTEADLVREKIKDGDQDDTTDHVSTAPRSFIRDPVLAHGVDFIEGVAALHLGKG
jgi:hypothetical protein